MGTITNFTPAVNALISWQDFQTITGFPDTQQNQTQYFINVASQLCEDFCNRKLAAVTLTSTLNNYSVNDGLSLVLPEYPVNSITSINIDPQSLFQPATLVPSTDYWFDSKTGVVYFNGTFVPCGPQVVQVVFNAGYTTIPLTIEHAVIESVLWLNGRVQRRTTGDRTTNYDGVTTTFETTLPITIQQLLQDYKRVIA
jgi:hypothetical protein